MVEPHAEGSGAKRFSARKVVGSVGRCCGDKGGLRGDERNTEPPQPALRKRAGWFGDVPIQGVGKRVKDGVEKGATAKTRPRPLS